MSNTPRAPFCFAIIDIYLATGGPAFGFHGIRHLLDVFHEFKDDTKVHERHEAINFSTKFTFMDYRHDPGSQKLDTPALITTNQIFFREPSNYSAFVSAGDDSSACVKR